MKLYTSIISFLLFSVLSKAQQGDSCIQIFDSISKIQVYTVVTEMPEYPGGDNSFFKYFMHNFSVSEQEEFQGYIYVSFIISAEGDVRYVTSCRRNNNGLSGFDREAIKVISGMGKWKPGKCKGIEVPVKLVLPIHF